MTDYKPEWEVNSFHMDDTNTEADFRDSGEVWIWQRTETGASCLQLSLRDIQELAENMEYLFRVEELGNMIEDMENDPMNDVAGFVPDNSDANGQKWITKMFVQRLERQRHYINHYDASVLVKEYFEGRS